MSRLFEAFPITDGKGNTRMLHHLDAPSRLRAVKACISLPLLREALTADDLQKAVRTAIERRIRKLERLS